MNWYLEAIGKYATFTGRARRKEYWMFVLLNILISVGLIFGQAFSGIMMDSAPGILYNLYSLAVLIPSLAVSVRRMHDTDHSGWWILVPFVNLYFSVSEGDRKPNRFGPDPKAGEA